MFLKELRCVFGSSFSVVPIFLCFLSLQIFLRKLWLVFHPSLSLCILSFCASVPCRCSCESFGVFSAPLFLCVSYLFVLQFLAVVPVRVLAYFLSLSLSVFLIFLCFYSLQMFLREFGVFSVPLFLCVSCHNQPSHSPIVLPPTCQPRQISGKKSFQQKSLAHFSP